MKTPILAAVAACAVGLSACNTTSAVGGYHDSIKANGLGVYANPTIGAGAAQFSVTVDRSANVDKTGAAIKVEGGCKEDSPDTYANLNNKGTVAATSITQAAAAVAAGASAGAPGVVNSPSITITVGDVTANGGAALIAAASQTSDPADTLAAYCLNNTLPNAPGGTIVRQGVSPASSTTTTTTATPAAAAAPAGG